MTARGSPEHAVPELNVDPLLTLLSGLARDGKLVAAFESAHASFLGYQEAAVRIAASANADGESVDSLREIFDAYLDLFHAHHFAEENHLFPTLRRVEPALAAAVDQLVVQHGQLATQVDVVSQLVRRRDLAIATDAMAVVLQELLALQNIVVEHLAFEESVTVPVISLWTEWPTPGLA
jgi:hemerythrin-like domain-containing protein